MTSQGNASSRVNTVLLLEAPECRLSSATSANSNDGSWFPSCKNHFVRINFIGSFFSNADLGKINCLLGSILTPNNLLQCFLTPHDFEGFFFMALGKLRKYVGNHLLLPISSEDK